MKHPKLEKIVEELKHIIAKEYNASMSFILWVSIFLKISKEYFQIMI
ncbi:MAG: hypothetical protein ACP5LM_02960 [Thermoplasmata archaeon]